MEGSRGIWNLSVFNDTISVAWVTQHPMTCGWLFHCFSHRYDVESDEVLALHTLFINNVTSKIEWNVRGN
jgi:hypothetical protein